MVVVVSPFLIVCSWAIRIRLRLDFPSEMRSGWSGLYLDRDSARSEIIAGLEWRWGGSSWLVCAHSQKMGMLWLRGRKGTSATLSLCNSNEQPLCETSLPMSDKLTAGEPGRGVQAWRARRSGGSGGAGTAAVRIWAL